MEDDRTWKDLQKHSLDWVIWLVLQPQNSPNVPAFSLTVSCAGVPTFSSQPWHPTLLMTESDGDLTVKSTPPPCLFLTRYQLKNKIRKPLDCSFIFVYIFFPQLVSWEKLSPARISGRIISSNVWLYGAFNTAKLLTECFSQVMWRCKKSEIRARIGV